MEDSASGTKDVESVFSWRTGVPCTVLVTVSMLLESSLTIQYSRSDLEIIRNDTFMRDEEKSFILFPHLQHSNSDAHS